MHGLLPFKLQYMHAIHKMPIDFFSQFVQIVHLKVYDSSFVTWKSMNLQSCKVVILQFEIYKFEKFNF